MSSSVPAYLQTRLASLFARMQARGLLTPMTVYMRGPIIDPVTNKPVGRGAIPIGTIQVWNNQGGGSQRTAQEGPLTADTEQIYYPLDANSGPLITNDNYGDRWVKLAGNATEYRITNVTLTGPYAFIILQGGGTADAAGNVR